ncbi:hypothetical protein D3C75_785170 [compost metagenome]
MLQLRKLALPVSRPLAYRAECGHQLLPVALQIASALLQQLAVAFAFLIGLTITQQLLLQLLYLFFQCAQLGTAAFKLGIMGRNYSRQLKLLIAQHFQTVIAFLPCGMYAFDLVDIHRNLQLLQLLAQFLVADRLLGLILQRSHLILQLTDQIMNAQQILLGFIELAPRISFA